MDEGVRLRPGTADDFPAICDLLELVFHEEFGDDVRTVEGDIFEAERSIVADDEGAVVGHTLAYSRELTVPGAVLPAAHVSGVGVSPTHRRRGLLTKMMHRQLRDVAAAGREPIAVLWASEPTIYPRFGYGPAGSRLVMTIKNRDLRLPPPAEPAGRLRIADPLSVQAELSKVYDQLRAGRNGWSSRDDRWWRYVLTDFKNHRGGAGPRHAVVHEGPDGPTGYALWRVKDGGDEYGPAAEVQVREVIAADRQTYLALWRFLLSIDLTRTVTARLAGVDEPLQYLVQDPRQLGRSVLDSLWVRIVDVPAALAARRYAAPVDVVIDVTDPLLTENTGRWRLTGGPDGATCTRTADPADLACTVTELGGAYLGGASLAALAAAGRVQELTANARSATAAFGWHQLPQPSEVF